MMSEVGPLLESSTQQALIQDCTKQGVHIQCHDQNNVSFISSSIILRKKYLIL